MQAKASNCEKNIHRLCLREPLYESCLSGASVMSSRLTINRMISLLSLRTGATRTLHRNLVPIPTNS